MNETMTGNMTRNKLRLARPALAGVALLWLFASAAARPAQAETACVSCDGPDAAYHCHAYANEPIPEAALALFCTSRLADEYGHKSCAVVRGASACRGLAVHYPYDPNAGKALGPGQGELGDRSWQTDKEPETLGEFATETYDASKDAAKKTGEALGDAAAKTGNAIRDAGETINDATRKTLNCIKSALTDC